MGEEGNDQHRFENDNEVKGFMWTFHLLLEIRWNMSPMFMYKTPACGVAGMKLPEARSPNSSPEFSSWKRKVKVLK
jgi:hypothetical protein